MNHRLIVILINHGHIKWHLVKTHSHFLLKAVFTDEMMYSQKRTVVTPCQFVFWKDKSNPSCLTTSQLTSTNSVISRWLLKGNPRSSWPFDSLPTQTMLSSTDYSYFIHTEARHEDEWRKWPSSHKMIISTSQMVLKRIFYLIHLILNGLSWYNGFQKVDGTVSKKTGNYSLTHNHSFCLIFLHIISSLPFPKPNIPKWEQPAGKELLAPAAIVIHEEPNRSVLTGHLIWFSDKTW